MTGDPFQMLADPTRRMLVEELRRGERSVSELVQVVPVGQPAVSRQLGILEGAHFVSVRPEGRRRLYALRPEPFRDLDEWVAGYRQIWEARLDRLGSAVAGKKRKEQDDAGNTTVSDIRRPR